MDIEKVDFVQIKMTKAEAERLLTGINEVVGAESTARVADRWTTSDLKKVARMLADAGVEAG